MGVRLVADPRRRRAGDPGLRRAIGAPNALARGAHIAERYGLFTIIVLGECVLATTTAVQASLATGGLSGDLVAVAAVAVGLLHGWPFTRRLFVPIAVVTMSLAAAVLVAYDVMSMQRERSGLPAAAAMTDTPNRSG